MRFSLDRSESPTQAHWPALVVITAFALVWRFHTFGNPTLHVDDQFYFLVGQRMHEGLLPYVDMWDRKPFGLFLIYYAIASISFEPIAYQIVAWFFVSLTGFVVYRCGMHWASRTGSLFGGFLYIAALHISGGEGGQAPVFYNLLVALASLFLFRWLASDPRKADRRVWLAMGSLGLALTIKQTVIFEAAALGLFVLWWLWRSGAGKLQLASTAIIAMALGAAPTIASFIFFAASGHFEVFWHAMILSNAAKAYPDLTVIAARALLRLIALMPLLVPAALSFINMGEAMRRYRTFLLIWLGAAILGFVAVPNFYLHYTLPLWVPICVIATGSLDRRWLGPMLLAACISYSAVSANPFSREWTDQSRRELEGLGLLINDIDDGDTMLVFEGPSALYSSTDRRFLSPLLFPTHLSWDNERDVSHLDTNEEIRRIIGERPDVVVMLARPRSRPENLEAWRLVRDYASNHCRLRREAVAPEIYRRWSIDIYAQCVG